MAAVAASFPSTDVRLAEYEAILRSALDPIVTIGLDGVIRTASNSVKRVFGWTPSELVGRNVAMLMVEPQRSEHDDYLRRYRETGVTNILNRAREFEAVRKDGGVFPIEISIARVERPGEALFIGILRDISERKRLTDELARHRDDLEDMVAARTKELERSHAQLRQADRLASIGTLAAGLGHDMNNVLLPIRARMDVLEQLAASELEHENLRAIRTSIEYLQHLADGLHLLSRDPGDGHADGERTSIHEWWRKVSPLLARGLKNKTTRLETDIADHLPEVAVASHRLTQAVLNLIVNAGEAVGENGTVAFRARLDPEDPGFVHLIVEDDGEGMRPEVLRRALDPFFTTKKRGLGTGLGLSLVHGVVQAAGGRIDIESAPGQGTKMHINLPVAASPERCHDDPAAVPTVAIRIADMRMRSLIEALLAGSSAEVVDESGARAGDAPDIVIAEGAARLPHGWTNARQSRRPFLIIIGPRDESISGAVFVDPGNFDQLRSAIGRALHETSV